MMCEAESFLDPVRALAGVRCAQRAFFLLSDMCLHQRQLLGAREEGLLQKEVLQAS